MADEKNSRKKNSGRSNSICCNGWGHSSGGLYFPESDRGFLMKKRKELPKFDVTKEVPEIFSFGKIYGYLLLASWGLFGIAVVVKFVLLFLSV